MTQEELRQFKARVKFTLFAQGITIAMNGEKVLEVIVDLEQARAERDDAIKDGLVQAVRIDELTETVKVLSERLAEVTKERDDMLRQLADAEISIQSLIGP